MSQKQVRLPNLKKLKVKHSTISDKGGPCMVVMSNLLNCWASNSHGAEPCKGLEQELKVCMGTKNVSVKRKSTMNYHAARLHPKINPKAHD